MKIAILGTRGIPNNYGGFEQFAEKLSVGLTKKGHNVVVYNPHFHEFKKKKYKKVIIKRIFSPEKYIGSAANYFYDLLCLLNAKKQKFDIIYECGYQSASFSYLLVSFNPSVLITNMDGIEWKRAKWNRFVKIITRLSERIAVKRSDFIISDNVGIKKYLLSKYNKNSQMIPYGAEIIKNFDENIIKTYNLKPYDYYLNIARLEPENHIEMIIQGVLSSTNDYPLVIIGNTFTKYGKYLTKKYLSNTRIRFLNAIYNPQIINNLRHFSLAYFHGHSVGGTNPALLEAMACGSFVIAHDNIFNRHVLPNNELFFNDKEKINAIITDKTFFSSAYILKTRKENVQQIKDNYLWEDIINQYEQFFKNILLKK